MTPMTPLSEVPREERQRHVFVNRQPVDKSDLRLRSAVHEALGAIEGRHGCRQGDAPQARLVSLIVEEVPEGDADGVHDGDEVDLERLEDGLGRPVLRPVLLESRVEAPDFGDAGVRQDDVDVAIVLLA